MSEFVTHFFNICLKNALVIIEKFFLPTLFLVRKQHQTRENRLSGGRLVTSKFHIVRYSKGKFLMMPTLIG